VSCKEGAPGLVGRIEKELPCHNLRGEKPCSRLDPRQKGVRIDGRLRRKSRIAGRNLARKRAAEEKKP